MIECLSCGRQIDEIPCHECAADGWENGCAPRCEYYKPCECDSAAADLVETTDERAARRDQAKHKAQHGIKMDGAALKTFGRGRRTS